MKKLLFIFFIPFVLMANPTSGWDEDSDLCLSCVLDLPLFWGLVLLFGGALIFAEIKRVIKPHVFDNNEPLGLGCMIPTIIMFVLGIMYFINY